MNHENGPTGVSALHGYQNAYPGYTFVGVTYGNVLYVCDGSWGCGAVVLERTIAAHNHFHESLT